MSLGNQVKDKKKSAPAEKTVTLPVNDWKILCASLQLMSENVGRLAVPSEAVGNIHKNCTVLIAAIEAQLSKT